jgi:putative glutamine amidotransferase
MSTLAPRPRIAVLGRMSESASALRYRAVVSSRALLESIWAAGGEPLTLVAAPGPDGFDWPARLLGVDGVLLPGGGDIDPSRYTSQARHPEIYDVDPLQDEADFSLTRFALEVGLPLLAVCRGMHVLNVALGGTLEQHMEHPHRHLRHRIHFDRDADLFGAAEPDLDISCFHHQRIDRLGDGLTAVAHAEDGTIEAVTSDAQAWTVGVQWHPEDLALESPAALAVIKELVYRSR